jgi:hypothetical protein
LVAFVIARAVAVLALVVCRDFSFDFILAAAIVTSWNPLPGPLHVEDKITEFDKTLKFLHQQLSEKHKHKKLTNLTPFQVKTLKELKNNKDKDITIKPTDKNLGPAVLNTSHYINQVLKEHLLTPAYRQLSYLEVRTSTDNIKATLKKLIQTNSQRLSKAELTYFERSLRTHHISFTTPENITIKKSSRGTRILQVHRGS